MAGFRAVRVAVVAAGILASGLSVAGTTALNAHAASPAGSGTAPSAAGAGNHLRHGVTPVLPAHPGSNKPASSAAALSVPSNAHLNYYGGRVVSTIHVVEVLYGQPSSTVTYEPEVQNTSPSPSIATFYGGVANSSYVNSMSEYDTTGSPQGIAGTNQTIGRGVFNSQVIIKPSSTNDPFAVTNPTHTIDDTNIQAEIQAQISAHKLPAPLTNSAGNLETLYAVYFPHGVTITLQELQRGRDQWGHLLRVPRHDLIAGGVLQRAARLQHRRHGHQLRERAGVPAGHRRLFARVRRGDHRPGGGAGDHHRAATGLVRPQQR